MSDGGNVMFQYWLESNNRRSASEPIMNPINGEATEENLRRNSLMIRDARIKFEILKAIKFCKEDGNPAVTSTLMIALEKCKRITLPKKFTLVDFICKHLLSLVGVHQGESNDEAHFKLKSHVSDS